MAEKGINVARDGSMDPKALADSGARWARMVATDDHDLRDYMKACQDEGVRVLLLIARESLPTLNKEQTNLGEAAQHAAELYQARYDGHFDALQVCNEPDGPPDSSSWAQSVDDVNLVIQTFRQAFPDAFIVGPGLCSGDPSKFDGVDVSPLNAISVHPYGQGVPAGDGLELFPSPFGFGGEGAHIGHLINNYQQFGKPIWVSEWGSNDTDMANATDMGGEANSATYVGRMMRHLRSRGDVDAAFYFCWSDSMVASFGLSRADGGQKSAFAEYVNS